MNQEISQQQQIRLYLLGLMTDAELAAIDERVVTQQDFYEQLLIVEDDLIDEYVNHELEAGERERFEKYFLVAPERHEKLKFSLGLAKYLKATNGVASPEIDPQPVFDGHTRPPKPPPRGWSSRILAFENPGRAFAVMVLAVLLVAGGLWFVFKNRSHVNDAGPSVAILLKPNLTRSDGSANKFAIAAGTGSVALKLAMTSDVYTAYQAVLLGDDNTELTRADGLSETTEAGTRVITFRVPAHLLPPGDYSVRVTGISSSGEKEELRPYRFRVN